MALVSMMDSITSLPDEFSTAIEIASYIIPISIRGVPLWWVRANTQNLLQQGGPVMLRAGGLLHR
jgi:hypothetical protein